MVILVPILATAHRPLEQSSACRGPRASAPDPPRNAANAVDG